LKEHGDLIQSQLNFLVNEMNPINDQFNTEILIHHFSQQLNEWDDDYDKFIQYLFTEKCDIYDQYFVKRIDQLRKNIVQLRCTISELIDQQDTTNKDITLLTLIIRCIKQEMEIIKQKRILDNLSSFITDKLIYIEQSKTIALDLSTLSLPFQTIICKNPLGSALANNNQRLLMDQRVSLHLFDQDLILKKQYQWKNGFIRNICWSSTLKNFIFITNNNQVYLVNDNITSIEHIQTIQEQDWCSCTCSDTSLFLTTNTRGSYIFKFNLSLIFEVVQRWKPPHSCQQHEFIHDIVYNNQTLALMIEDSFSNMVHMELRLSATLDLVWSFRPDIKCHLFQPAIRCCSLKHDEWLIIDSNNSRLFHINNGGKIKDSYVYKSPPWNAILLGSNILAIRTENSLNFHQIYGEKIHVS
jgi:hypothetical protein